MRARQIWTNIASFFFAILLIGLGIRYVLRDRPLADTVPNRIKVWFPEFDINAMAQQGGILWIGGKNGVKALDLETLMEIQLEDAFGKLDYVKSMAVDSLGILWIGHFNGISKVDGKELSEFLPQNQLPDLRVNCIYRDHSNRMWVGTWKGAFYWEGDEWQSLPGEGLIHSMVNVIYQDHLGGMWFGSYIAPEGGVSYFNDDNWRHWTLDQGLIHANVTSFAELEDQIWVGTGLFQRGGAVLIDLPNLTNRNLESKVVQVFRKRDGLAGEKVRSLCCDSLNRLWIGSEYDGISILINGAFQYMTTKNGLSHNEVKYFLETSSGLWIGTRSGLNLINLSDE